MPKSKRDIIYILKPELDTDELVYSLRSIEKNFPHRNAYFIGGQPKGLKPDVAVPHIQTGADKWEKIRSSMLKAATIPELSEEFFLFNDDFFVMKPFNGTFVNYIDKTIDDRLDELRLENPWLNMYARTLYKANEELKALKYPRDNYEVHLPMLFEKSKINTVLTCSSPQMRSVYGNVNRVKHVQHKDVKVYDMETVPDDPDFLSTNDKTWGEGKVGEYIRECFKTPSRFEI